jgi:alanyl-tRNA synthetase
MAGKEATKRGIDAREIAGETAGTVGGGGSGKPDFAQGGGTLIDRIPEALRKAEEIIKKQLKNEAK